MGVGPYTVHRGSGFPLPKEDPYQPMTGAVTWFEAEPVSVSTSGPSIVLQLDLQAPRAKGREQIAVLRVRDAHDYLPAAHPEFVDDDGWLAVSATLHVPEDGTAEDVQLAIPYAALPEGLGGLLEIEVALHEPVGTLVALEHQSVYFPEDVDRHPDPLTVVTHTLVTLVKSTQGTLQRDEVRTVREILVDHFDLDDLGDEALRRILKMASRVDHDLDALAAVAREFVPASYHERLVTTLYAVAEADSEAPTEAEQAFIERLLDQLGIHDHVRFGPEHLLPHYAALELEPGAPLDAVKAAWKALLRDYHPDKVAHLPKGFAAYATERTKAINAAKKELELALTQGGDAGGDERPADAVTDAAQPSRR